MYIVIAYIYQAHRIQITLYKHMFHFSNILKEKYFVPIFQTEKLRLT